MEPERVARVEIAGARGVALGTVPAEIATRVDDWIEGRDAPGSIALRAGRVWSFEGWIAKRGTPRKALANALRRGPARRSFANALRLAPVRVPRPVCALERRAGLVLRSDLFVCERIEGRSLFEVFTRDERALEAFPAFVASLAEQGALHGDLHPENCLWTGVEWALIDLDALRGGLHQLFAERMVEKQWARLLRNLDYEPRVRALFEAFALRTGRDASAWPRIEARARAMPPVRPNDLERIRRHLGGD